MSQIYSIAKNTQPTTPSPILHLALIGVFLFAMSTFAKADTGYECEMMEDGVCVIWLEDVLPDTATDDDALKYCEKFNGVYMPEEDACQIED